MFKDFIRGIHASVRPWSLRAVAVAYGLLVVFAGLFTIAIYDFVWTTTRGSAMAAQLEKGVDIDWAIDTIGGPGFGAAFGVLTALAVALVPAYLAVSVFLSGGIVSAVRRALGLDDDTAKVSFLTYCAWYLGPMARLAILEIVVLVALVVGMAFGATGGGPSTRANAIAWAWLGGSLFVLALVASVFDYARIHVVAAGRRSAFASLGAGLRVVGRKPLAVAVLTLLNMVLSLGVWIGFVWLHSRVDLSTAGGVVAGVLVGQVGIVGRVWTRVVAYASETSLASRVWAEPARVVEAPAEPVEVGEVVA